MESGKKYCKCCGEIIDVNCVICPKCGKQIEMVMLNTPQPSKHETNGLGIAGMVIGIIALVLSICGGIGGFLGIIGLVLSFVAVCLKNKPKGAAIAGLVCNLISVLILVAFIIYPSSPKEKEINNTRNDQSINNSESTSETISDDGIIDVTISDCHITYLKHEIVENMAGDECIAIYYEFTNNSDEGKTFDYVISEKAFQNGVELNISLFHLNDESKNSSSEIKPGVTITVCSGFVLRDATSDIELEVNKWISLDDTPKDTMILSIN